MKRAIFATILVAATPSAAAPEDPFDEPAVRALEDELARTMQKLELTGSAKPYFVSFSMSMQQQVSVTASFGTVMNSQSVPKRTLDIDLRVGDQSFDNSNFGFDQKREIRLPVEPDYGAIRREVWLAVDRKYKHLLEVLERKRAVVAAEAPNPNEVGSLSKEPPTKILAVRAPVPLDLAKLEGLARRLSAVFRKNPEAAGGYVSIEAMDNRNVFLSSEGSRAAQSASLVRIEAVGHTYASDGMPIHDTVEFWAATVDQLPTEADMLAQVEKLSGELSALRKAPVVDDFAGPVLFRGIAAGQVVRILLSENLSGSLGMRPDRPGGTAWGDSELVGKLGQRILPVGISIVDDPTVQKVGKLPLLGATPFDEEGIPAQRVSLVESGTLKNFLMSRLPRKGFEHSNGHAASTQWAPTRAHPTHLIVSASTGLAANSLAQRAQATAAEAKVGYYYVVDKLVQRRFFDDERSAPDETLPRPVIMRRVYADGREELVRGGSFGPVSIRMLRDVIAGDVQTSYSYLGSGMPSRYTVLGGDSPGGFIATIVSPTLLLKDVDVRKPRNTKKRPPLIPRPNL